MNESIETSDDMAQPVQAGAVKPQEPATVDGLMALIEDLATDDVIRAYATRLSGQVGGPTKEQVMAVIDSIAEEWDSFECDVAAVGMVDIGDAVRRDGFAKVNRLYAATPSPTAQAPSSQQECADLRNVIQAACAGGLPAMAEAWAKYFPDKPISIRAEHKYPPNYASMLRNALAAIAHWPCPEQDDMQAANMRETARDALDAFPIADLIAKRVAATPQAWESALRDALREMLAAESAPFPLSPFESRNAGIAAQNAWANRKAAAHQRARELLAATPQAGSSNPAGMTEAQKETLLGLIKQVCPTDTAAPQPSPAGACCEGAGTCSHACAWGRGYEAGKIAAAPSASPLDARDGEEDQNSDLPGYAMQPGTSDTRRIVTATQMREFVAKRLAHVVKDFDEIRGILDETYRFAATSPRSQENINAVCALLDAAVDAAITKEQPYV